MGELEREELANRIGAMDREELETVASIIPSDILISEMKGRVQSAELKLSAVRAALNGNIIVRKKEGRAMAMRDAPEKHANDIDDGENQANGAEDKMECAVREGTGED